MTPLLYPRLGRRVGWWAVGVAALVFIFVLTLIPTVSSGEVVEYSLNWVPSLGINLSFFVDGLSLLFAILVSGIGVLILTYANFYLSPKENLGKFFAIMLFFMGSMLGTILASNLIVLFISWELMSLSCFLLIGFWDEVEETRKAAIKALLVTGVGGLAMLAGFVILHLITGSWEIREILNDVDLITDSHLFGPALILIAIGAFSKSAQFPLHFWLPGAMAAPTPVSAYLHAATMVKAGIFLLARFSPVFSNSDLWLYFITPVGLFTMVIGAYMALRQKELKALLAYSTVSQLGLVIALLGYSVELGVIAAVFHVVNHALFKGSLFLVAGSIDHCAGTRIVKSLGGLAAVMPWTALFAGIAALSMAGVPPLNGFISKELFYEASLEGLNWIVPIVAVLGALMTFVYSLRLFHGVFFGRQTPDTEHAHEACKGMLIPIGILSSLCVVIGLFPGLISGWLLEPAISAVLQHPVELHLGLWHGFELPLLMTVITISLGLLVYWRLREFLRSQEGAESKWSVAYLYERWFLGFMIDGTAWIFNRFQSGYLRYYLMMISLFIMGLVGYTLVVKSDLTFPGFSLNGIELYEYALAGLMIVAAIATVLARERVSAIIAIGAVGALVVVFWVLYSAPDLALTQILIEIISVVLFVLVFYHALPFAKPKMPRTTLLRDIAISVGFGALITVIMLTVIYDGTPFDSFLRDAYLANAHEVAGARNIVNVIIVDFRGYDTMGEITVLAIAAIALFCLHKLRKKESQ